MVPSKRPSALASLGRLQAPAVWWMMYDVKSGGGNPRVGNDSPPELILYLYTLEPRGVTAVTAT